MGRLIDMTGKRIGHLIVLRRASHGLYGRGHAAWVCKCDCGKKIVADGTLLRRGYYSSCGCMRRKRLHDIAYKHGMTNTSLSNYEIAHILGYITPTTFGERFYKICVE